MIAEKDLPEYLAEIRQHVCSKCIERPPGGPPCAPLGKSCGIEVNLGRLVEEVHMVRNAAMDPYMIVFHDNVCSCCPASPTEQCPCPLKYLLLLAVEAIETVDERRALRAQACAV